MTGRDEMDDLTPEGADAALAGEYVLGVLDMAERAAAERRIKTDPVFAGRVAKWEMQFAGMNDSFAEVKAPALLPQIEARLFGKPETRAAAAKGSVAGWWTRFIGGAGMAGALAVMALVLVAPPAPPPAPGPLLTATLLSDGQPLVFAARYDVGAGALLVERTGGSAADAGQVHELWLIAGQAAPVSLGLIEAGPLTRNLPALPEGAVLAVSLEPAGGSTTGAPTGPVLVTGVIERSI